MGASLCATGARKGWSAQRSPCLSQSTRNVWRGGEVQRRRPLLARGRHQSRPREEKRPRSRPSGVKRVKGGGAGGEEEGRKNCGCEQVSDGEGRREGQGDPLGMISKKQEGKADK